MTPEDEEGFLSRWSRRKRVQGDEATPPAPEPAAADPEPDAPGEPTLTDEDLAALPKIEDLVAGSDIRAFLRPGVPAALKNAALRKMWMLTPAIRDYRDPAVDYAWDWNTPGGVPGDGVGPSAERAAQMLRDLLDPRPPRQPVADAPETDAPAMAEQADPVNDHDSSPVTPTQAAEKPAESPVPDAPAPARPRHGGALPS